MRTILIAATLALTACAPTTLGGNLTSSDIRTSVTVPAAPPADPYSSTGTWLVPDEIAPGTYRVSLTGTRSMGYSEVCADHQCEIGTDGFISNENYSGPGVLVIPSTAVMVTIKGITLTPMPTGGRQ